LSGCKLSFGERIFLCRILTKELVCLQNCVPVHFYFLEKWREGVKSCVTDPDQHCESAFGPPGSGFVIICTDPDLDPVSGSFHYQTQIVLFCDIFMIFFLSLKTDVNVRYLKSNKQINLANKICFCWYLEGQCYGSADLDPYQNVTDPHH
jgi:hypothetical protein